MPKRPSRKTSAADRVLQKKSQASVHALNRQRFASTGPSTRIQGHVAAHGRRSQAKRDAR